MLGPLAFEGVPGSAHFSPVHMNENSRSLFMEGPKAGVFFSGSWLSQ